MTGLATSNILGRVTGGNISNISAPSKPPDSGTPIFSDESSRVFVWTATVNVGG
jgi:hypothetical protein